MAEKKNNKVGHNKAVDNNMVVSNKAVDNLPVRVEDNSKVAVVNQQRKRWRK